MNRVILFLSLSFLITVSQASAETQDSVTQKITVVATNSIIGDWIKQIANDHVTLVTLVGPDTDNHTFEPTSQDAVHILNSDIIFENGLGLEYWLNSLYKSSQSKAKRIALSDSLSHLLPVDCHGHFKCTHSHSHELDPHIWLNPLNVIAMVEKITNVLIEADPKNADDYRKRSANYINQLNDLHSWIIKQITKIPSSNRKLVTNHDSFRYFAEQYGFATLGDVLGSNSTENVDPSAVQFSNLVKIIHKNKVPAIFGENIQNDVLINNLAAEAKLPKPKLLYTEALSKKDGPAKNYIELMQHNVDILVGSLK